MKAVEVTGQINNKGKLTLDHPLTYLNKRVRVIILISEEEDINDQNWLKNMSLNPAFDFLKSEDEDIYSIEDGEPVKNEA
ncbi:MAG: hypothetical protein KDC66_10090 [Phaeodactylibacter sp.]|nr:hypothetical protein [Phaeodactylibacter sp.]MCB9276340.1 hypothetical protein [Lewinellaceae bacterium]